MIPPGAYDITIYQGANFSLTITVVDDAGTPLDFTGASFSAQARANYADEVDTVLFEFYAVAGVDPGTLSLTLSAVETELLSGRGRWDLEITWPDASVDRLLMGKWSVSREVTREAA